MEFKKRSRECWVYEKEWWHFNWKNWKTYPLHIEIFEELDMLG